LSNNVGLKFLNCEYNQLTNLDLSNNVGLEEPRYHYNKISNLNKIKIKKVLEDHLFFKEVEAEFRKEAIQKLEAEKDKKIRELEGEIQMEREEAKKALEKAKEWRERQIKELTDRKNKEKTEAIRNLEKEKREKINELETTKKQKEQELTNKIAELEQEKQKLEKNQEQIKNQVLQERKELENKLRNKINGKLEKGGILGGLFKPSKQGGDLEEATDNLLEKQQQLENQIYNLKKDIGGIDQQLREEKAKYTNERLQLKKRIDKIIGDKNAWLNYESESLDVAIDKLFGNHQIYVESTGDKCVRVVTAPFK